MANDIITHANGTAIDNSSRLVMLIGDAEPGDQLVLRIYRAGQTLDLTVIVGEQIQNTRPERINRE